MAVYDIKQGATAPPLRATLKDKKGAIALVGAAVYFYFRPWEDPTGTRLGGQCTVLDDGTPANKGKIQYDWTTPDTATPGTYRSEFSVIFAPASPDEKIERIPNKGYDTLEIRATVA